MLKIGTSKAGTPVECPRCRQSVVVPPQSAPQAEEWYRAHKDKQRLQPAAEQKDAEQKNADQKDIENDKNASSVPTWEELENEDADMPLWMEEAYQPSPADPLPPFSSAVPHHHLADEVALMALKKRHRLTVTLLNLLMVVLFFSGMVFGIFIENSFIAPRQRTQRSIENPAAASEVTGVLYYFNEDGERRVDTDAVIICLPMDRSSSALLSCQGLRPADTMNHDAVQMIHEMKGIYEKADAHGAFSFPYQEDVRYCVILISANQKNLGAEMKPGEILELRRYFSDPELLHDLCLEIDEYTWPGGKYSFRHTFESGM